MSDITRTRNGSGTGSKLLFIEDPPELAFVGVNAPQFYSTTSATTIKAQRLVDQQNVDAMLRSLSQKYEWVHSVQVADLYLTNGDRVTARDGNVMLYRDNNHLSLAGARLAKQRIANAITNLVESATFP
jgi:hypothetical protein